jgi:hypothetical protein
MQMGVRAQQKKGGNMNFQNRATSKTVAQSSFVSIFILSIAIFVITPGCAKRSNSEKSKQAPIVDKKEQVQPSEIKVSMQSKLASILHDGDTVTTFRASQLDSAVLNRYTVKFEFPRDLFKGARIVRLINGLEREVQLSGVIESGDSKMIGTDSVLLEEKNPFKPVSISYRWEANGKILELEASAKRSWFVNGEVKMREFRAQHPNLYRGQKFPDEIELEYFLIGEKGHLIIGSEPLKIRADVIGSESGSRIDAFNANVARPDTESSSSGVVLLQAKLMTGRMIVNLNGANGRDGLPGAHRHHWERGEDGAPSTGGGFGPIIGCFPAKTNPGGPGLKGHPGGRGEDGGAGGSMILRTPPGASLLEVEYQGIGGKGGGGGIGGHGSPGGRGSPERSYSDMCEPAPAGANGPEGPQGDVGAPGADSTVHGTLQVLPLAPETQAL